MFDLKHALADIRAKAIRVAKEQDWKTIKNFSAAELLKLAHEEQLKFENPKLEMPIEWFEAAATTWSTPVGGHSVGAFLCEMHGGYHTMAEMQKRGVIGCGFEYAYRLCPSCAERWDAEHPKK